MHRRAQIALQKVGSIEVPRALSSTVVPISRGLRMLHGLNSRALFGGDQIAVAYEMFGNPHPGALDPREWAIVSSANEKRKRAFAAGRTCAHAALAKVSKSRGPLLPDAAGQPIWPHGLRGSITHTDRYAVAAVLREASPYAAIGLDADVVGAVTEDVAELVFTPTERSHLATLDAPASLLTATVMFCAKEAFYKAQFPLTGRWIDFQEVEVCLNETGAALLRVPGMTKDAMDWPGNTAAAARGQKSVPTLYEPIVVRHIVRREPDGVDDRLDQGAPGTVERATRSGGLARARQVEQLGRLLVVACVCILA
jgi:4'-phosphopantetheinyl transferase EntD